MRVAIIPARGGSRRIPKKNIRPFHGKPIIAYSIEAAQASGLFDAIYVSTDDHDTMVVASQHGCFLHLRSTARLCGDEAGTQEVAKDCLLHSTSGQYTETCCIYATAPMLRPFDLTAGLALLDGHPFAYVPGIYYWGQADAFLSDVPLSAGLEVPYPPERYVDINTPEDWAKAERMYSAFNDAACIDAAFRAML